MSATTRRGAIVAALSAVPLAAATRADARRHVPTPLDELRRRVGAIRARLGVYPLGHRGASYRDELDATLAVLGELVDVLDKARVTD